MLRKICLILMGCLFLVNSSAAGEIKTNWIYKKDEKGSSMSMKIYKIELVRNMLRFHMLFHNSSKRYLCFYVSAAENISYMDDELANEYFGASFRVVDGKSNKLGPNQRKKAIWEINAPVEDVDFVNLRMGIHKARSSSTNTCSDSSYFETITDHKIDWDISKLRK